MNYIDIIILKYPGIQGVTYWLTQSDGTPWKDPYDGLVWENKEIKKPTPAEIVQWEPEVFQQYVYQQNHETNKPIYDQLDIIDLKSIRALRENDSARVLQLEDQAQALRAQLLPVS